MKKEVRFLTNSIDADGGVHLPLDLQGHDAEHVLGQGKIIEGMPVHVPRGDERRPVLRDTHGEYRGLEGYSGCLNQMMSTPHFAYRDGHRIS